jgi:hypothetical protein
MSVTKRAAQMPDLKDFDFSPGINVTDRHIIAIHHEPYGEKGITFGKTIMSPLGNISVIFSHKHPIGKVLECPYIVGEWRRLHHASVVKLSTSHEGNVFVDDAVCMLGLGVYLMVGLTPTYALDGDAERFNESQED